MIQLRIYTNFRNAIRRFTDEEKGQLFDAMLAYAEDKTLLPLTGKADAIWDSVQMTLDAQHDAYDNKCAGAEKARDKKNSLINVDINSNQGESTQDNLSYLKDNLQEQEQIKEKKRKDNTKRIEESGSSALSVPSSFSLDLRNALDEWILYKQEQGFVYQAPGWNALINQLRKEAEQYGDDKVAEVIRYSMRNNYNGIVHARLKDAPKGRRANADYEQRKTQDADYSDVFLDLDALSKKYELEGKL